jgi:hypothetical protein
VRPWPGAGAAGVLLTVVALGTACTGSSTASLHPVDRTTSSPAVSPADERLGAIYSAALTAHLGMDSAVASPTFIRTTYEGSSTPVPEGVRAIVTRELAPEYDVEWVSSGSGVVGERGGSYLRLPMVRSHGNRVRVHLSTYCGNVCGTFVTWIVTRHGDRWTAGSNGAIGMS